MSTARERIADYIHGTALGYSQSAIERGSAMCDAYYAAEQVCRDCGVERDPEALLAASSDPNDAYYLCRDDERCWDRLTPEQQQAVIAREARP